jgi:hypothetical protein
VTSSAPHHDAHFSRWPSADGALAGALRLHVWTDEGYERTWAGWIDTATMPSNLTWPASDGCAECPTAQLVYEDEGPFDPAFPHRVALFGEQGIDQEDDFLGEAVLEEDGTVVFTEGPPDGFLGGVARGLVDAVQEGLRTPIPAWSDGSSDGPSSTWTAHVLPGEFPLRSWHLRRADENSDLHVLEDSDPVWDAAIENPRARRFVVISSLFARGLLVRPTDGGEPRWWAPGTTPLLDAPVCGQDIPAPLSELLPLLE